MTIALFKFSSFQLFSAGLLTSPAISFQQILDRTPNSAFHLHYSLSDSTDSSRENNRRRAFIKNAKSQDFQFAARLKYSSLGHPKPLPDQVNSGVRPACKVYVIVTL